MELPADARELALLGDAAKQIPSAILDGTYALPKTDGSGRDRKALRKVVDLLKEAGYEIRDNGLVNVATGEPFTFTISVASKEQEKIALHFQRTLRQIGIDARVRLVDAAQFSRVLQEYDFDMAPVTWYNSLSPGNEQTFYFGSAAGKTPGTRNYPGIADPAVDKMIDALTESAIAARISLLPCVPSTGCSSPAITSFRFMMPAASGWRAGRRSGIPRPSPCRASKPAPCGTPRSRSVMNKPWIPPDCAKVIDAVEASLAQANDLDSIEHQPPRSRRSA